MKKTKVILPVVLLSLLTFSFIRIGFIYNSVPDKIYILEGEEYSFDKYRVFSKLFSMTSAADTTGSLSREGQISANSSYDARVQLLGIPLKTVNVNTVSKPALIPCGTPIGIKLFAGGLEIIKSESFVALDEKEVNPASAIIFRKGDVITEVNGIPVKRVQDFSREISDTSKHPITLSITGSKGIYNASVTPVQEYGTGQYRVGLIVRDSMAGIGTMTYINPENGTFGALGHAIEDSDTDIIFPAKKGSVEEATVLSVTKGRKGAPGEIHGMFTGKKSLGTITSNTNPGIFGKMNQKSFSCENATPIAAKSEVKPGKASILCSVSENDVREYEIVIERILHMSADTSKDMVIRITDPILLSATGGIVQGMSGSPILQNGRIVGAVTHVFVNDPTRGYGIFIENMLAEAEKIK